MVTMQELREAQYRHARHYLEQLRVANEVYRGGGERVWQSLAQLQGDWDQIERGQSWVAQQPSDAVAADLCSEYPLAGSDVLMLRYTVADRIVWLQAALRAAVDLDLLRPRCAHLCALGHAHWEAGEVDQAKEYLERAIVLAEDINDPANLVQAHYELGIIAEQQFDLATANHHAQTCLDLYTDLNDRRGIASALLLFAGIRGYEGDFEEAERYAQESLERFRASGDLSGTARALARLGSLTGNQRKNTLAKQYFGESYDIYRKLGDPAGQGLTLRSLGVCATFQGNHAEARKWFEESLALYQRLGHQPGIGETHKNLGDNAQYTGAIERAREHYQLALAIFRSLQTYDDVANILVSMSSTVESLGQVQQAIEYALEARDIYRELGNQRWLAFTLSKLGMFTSERREFAQAEGHLTEGLAAAEASGDPWVIASVHFNWSKLEHLRGVMDKARDHWCQAFELAMGIHSPPMLVEGIRYLVDILVSAGQLELAYELAWFVTEHPSVLEGIKMDEVAVMGQIEPQVSEDLRQAAIARAQSRDLDAYCDLLLAECPTWSEKL